MGLGGWLCCNLIMNLPPADSTRYPPLPPVKFRHVAIVGKYQAPGARHVVEEIAQFLHAQGCEVSLEQQTAQNTGLTDYPSLDVPGIGRHAALPGQPDQVVGRTRTQRQQALDVVALVEAAVQPRVGLLQ